MSLRCVICLDNDKRQRAALKCGHHFHLNCINQAISRSKACPVCRKKISSNDIIPLFGTSESDEDDEFDEGLLDELDNAPAIQDDKLLAALNNKMAQLKRNLASAETDLQSSRDAEEQLHQRNRQLTTEKAALQRQLADKETRLDAALKESCSLEKQLRTALSKFKNADMRYSQLKLTLDTTLGGDDLDCELKNLAATGREAPDFFKRLLDQRNQAIARLNNDKMKMKAEYATAMAGAREQEVKLNNHLLAARAELVSRGERERQREERISAQAGEIEALKMQLEEYRKALDRASARARARTKATRVGKRAWGAEEEETTGDAWLVGETREGPSRKRASIESESPHDGAIDAEYREESDNDEVVVAVDGRRNRNGNRKKSASGLDIDDIFDAAVANVLGSNHSLEHSKGATACGVEEIVINDTDDSDGGDGDGDGGELIEIIPNTQPQDDEVGDTTTTITAPPPPPLLLQMHAPSNQTSVAAKENVPDHQRDFALLLAGPSRLGHSSAPGKSFIKNAAAAKIGVKKDDAQFIHRGPDGRGGIATVYTSKPFRPASALAKKSRSSVQAGGGFGRGKSTHQTKHTNPTATAIATSSKRPKQTTTMHQYFLQNSNNQ